MTRPDSVYDDETAEMIFQASERIPVDVDDGWNRLVGQLELTDSPRQRAIPRLLLIAAAAAVLLLAARPVVVSGTLATYDYVREVVGIETTTTLRSEAPTTVAPTTVPGTMAAPTTTSAPPPPSPPPPTTPPTTTTTTTAPVSSGHRELIDGTAYERDIRQVHIQLNDAIGYEQKNYGALVGADDIVEGLLGQRPEFDTRLRDTIGHLREAQKNSNRDAASQAHTIIETIEKELGIYRRQ